MSFEDDLVDCRKTRLNKGHLSSLFALATALVARALELNLGDPYKEWRDYEMGHVWCSGIA